MQGQAQLPLKLALRTGEASHTIEHEVLYSLKNKFVKGRPHKGTSWGIDYLVFPGYYLLWRLKGYKDNRGVEFTISKIRVIEDKYCKNCSQATYEEVEAIVKAEFPLWDFREFAKDQECPESLRLFITSLPNGYHSIGTVPDPSKVFTPDEVDRVRQFIQKKIMAMAEE